VRELQGEDGGREVISIPHPIFFAVVCYLCICVSIGVAAGWKTSRALGGGFFDHLWDAIFFGLCGGVAVALLALMGLILWSVT